MKHLWVESSNNTICKSKRSESKSSQFQYLPFGRASLNFANDLQSSRLTRCFLPFLLFRQEAITREVPTIMSFWPRGRTISLSDQHTITQSSVGNFISVPWEIIVRREKKLGKWRVQHVVKIMLVYTPYSEVRRKGLTESETLPTIWWASPPLPRAWRWPLWVTRA